MGSACAPNGEFAVCLMLIAKKVKKGTLKRARELLVNKHTQRAHTETHIYIQYNTLTGHIYKQEEQQKKN